MIYFHFGDKLLPSPIHQKVILSKMPGSGTELRNLEPGCNEVQLSEDLLKPVELLVEWTYKEKLPIVTWKTTADDCFNVMKLCSLANKYRQSDLTDQAMGFLEAYLARVLPCWDLNWCLYVYTHAAQGSPLRKLMAKWVVGGSTPVLERHKLTNEMLARVMNGHIDLQLDVLELLRFRSHTKFVPRPNKPSQPYHNADAPGSLEASHGKHPHIHLHNDQARGSIAEAEDFPPRRQVPFLSTSK